VTVPSGEGAGVAVIDRYDLAPGSLTVSKTIAGPAAGQEGLVTVQTECDGAVLDPVLTIPAGSAAGTTSHTYTGIPGDTACTATETADGSTDTVDVTITGDDGVPLTVPAGGQAIATVTDTYEPILGAVEVEKLIGGSAAGDQGEVTIHVACAIGESTTFTGDFAIAAGTEGGAVSQRFDDIASGSVCTVTETADGSTGSVSATVEGSPQVVTISPGATTQAQLSDTYDFDTGSLTVSKIITGPAAGQQNGVTIHAECDGEPLSPDLDVLAGTTASTSSVTYPNLPGRAMCVVTEQLDGSTETVRATVAGSPQFPTIAAGGSAIADVTNTYNLAPGSLIVNKTVSGPAAGRQGTIVIRVVCNGIPLTPDFVLPAMTAASTHSSVFTPIPATSTCTATEIGDGATNALPVTISGSGATHSIPPAGLATADLTDAYGSTRMQTHLELAATGVPLPRLFQWSTVAIATGLVLVGAAGRRRRGRHVRPFRIVRR
jgi:hypothetical protein